MLFFIAVHNVTFHFAIYRGIYLSAHVLLHLLSELGKEIKCEACQACLSLCQNVLNKYNDTGARMLDYIYDMTLKVIKITFLA